MTTQPLVITRREPVEGGQLTNVFVGDPRFNEVCVAIPNGMLDTPAMWRMIEVMMARREDTHDAVMDGDVR
jgi:hypothetical protein